MKYNLKLSLKSILRAELMLGKPFGRIDYSNRAELETLLYCAVLSNNKERITFDEFKTIVSGQKQLNSLIREFEKEMKILSQFREKAEVANESSQDNYISELVGMLILSGVSPEYVLNEMELFEIPFLLKACEKKKKEEMESRRLWTFYNILPHINARKVKSPLDMITFPWEEEERKSRAEEEMRKNEAEFMKFIRGDHNHLML